MASLTNSSSAASPVPTSLLAGLHCRGNIHLVIGTNPLAATRCTQSLHAGAHPVLIAPASSELHYSLQSKVDEGLVKWERKEFEDGDLLRLGREEVEYVVDAVFVTAGPRDPLSLCSLYCYTSPIYTRMYTYTHMLPRPAHLTPLQEETHPRQRRRCPPPLHLHPPVHPHRWTPPDRHHHQRPRLQAGLAHPSRHGGVAAARSGRRVC